MTGSRLHTTLRALIAATVVGLLLPVGGMANAAAVASSWAQAWAQLPSVTGSLASGVLTNNGTPSAGATLVLFAQPTQADAAAVPLSRSVTGDDGSWSIGAPPGADLSRFADPLSGAINFYVQAFDGTGSSIYYFSAQSAAAPAAASKLASAGSTTVSGTQRTLTVDPAATRSIALDSSQGSYTSQAAATGNTGAQKSGGAPGICVDKVLGTYDNLKSWIGYTASEAANTAAVHLTYTQGASSTFGVGISAGGGIGTFSAGGTYTISSSISADFPATHNVAYVNYYAYATYKSVRHTCVTGSVASSYDMFRPAYFDGGFAYERAARIAMGYCSGVDKGVTVHQAKSTAYQASGGVSASRYIGINLSAQTGYSTQLEIDYAMGSYGHPWCGLDGLPGGRVNSRLQTIHANVWSSS